jgi:Xaa-Pro aminopeptidase
VSEEQKKSDNRPRPTTEAFRAFVREGWAPRTDELPERAEVAPYAAARREAVSAAYPGERLVVPAGGLKVRSNDCDYVFRPHSAFAYLTGFRADCEPDTVLVLHPRSEADGGGHEAIVYFRPLAGRDTEEFFADARYGEFWVGARPTLEDSRPSSASRRGTSTSCPTPWPRTPARSPCGSCATPTATSPPWSTRCARGRPHRSRRPSRSTPTTPWRPPLAPADGQGRVGDRPDARGHRRDQGGLRGGHRRPRRRRRARPGERWVEGLFGLHARHQGNGTGYDSICAAGDHANTLHWIKNTGEVREAT